MSEIKEGSKVNCAFCKKEVTVQFLNEYSGTTGYNLTCFHRNALCPTCGQMAKDVSDITSKVEKHCVKCDPPLEDEEEYLEEEEEEVKK